MTLGRWRNQPPRAETCREAMPDHNRCGKTAMAILWGKLFPPEALGPRCGEHVAKHCGGRSMDELVRQGYALYDLRPVNDIHGLDPT